MIYYKFYYRIPMPPKKKVTKKDDQAEKPSQEPEKPEKEVS